jgi:hypothetical protein
MNDDSFPCEPLETRAALDLCERADVLLDRTLTSYAGVRAVTHRVLLLEIAANPVAESGYRDLPPERRTVVGTLDVLRDLYDPSDTVRDVRWVEGPPPAALAARVRATFAAAGLAPQPVQRWAEDTVAEIRARRRRTSLSLFIRTRPAGFVGQWLDPIGTARGAAPMLALLTLFTVTSIPLMFFTPGVEVIAADATLLATMLVLDGLYALGDWFGEPFTPRGRRFAAAAARAHGAERAQPAAAHAS